MSVICGRCANQMSIVNSMTKNMIVICHECGLQVNEWNTDNEGNYVAIINGITKQYRIGVVEYANIYKLDKSESVNVSIQQKPIRKCPNAPIIRRHYSRRFMTEDN